MLICMLFSRILVSSHSKIWNCKFINLGAQISQGGAIYMKGDYNLEVLACGFINCTVTTNGGAIFASGGNFNAKMVCFYKSYIKQSTNNVFGNAIYINSITNAEYLGANLCGISFETASDSTLYFYSFKTEISNSNCSECSGNGGPSGVGLDKISNQCIIRFFCIYGGISSHAMCFWTMPSLSINNILFINAQFRYQMWWLSSSNIKVDNCYIYKVTYGTFLTGGVLSFTNSFCDIVFSTTGLLKTSFILPVQVNVFYGDCQQPFYHNTVSLVLHQKNILSFHLFIFGLLNYNSW